MQKQINKEAPSEIKQKTTNQATNLERKKQPQEQARKTPKNLQLCKPMRKAGKIKKRKPIRKAGEIKKREKEEKDAQKKSIYIKKIKQI